MERIVKIIKYFEKLDEAILEIIQLEELQDIVSLSFYILKDENSFEQGVKKKAFKLLCRIAKMDRLTIEERWTLFWNIEHIVFISYMYDDCIEEMGDVYPSIYRSVEKMMPKALLEIEDTKNDGPIVIVTSQFLTLEHAPTRQIVDYAYIIQQEMGINVVIINDTGLKLKRFSYMQPSVQGNYIDEYEKTDKISYKDTCFSFYQTTNKNGWPDLKELENLVYNIKKLGPRLVLNIGGNCLTSDLCRKFAKTAASMVTTSMPSSMSEWLVLNRNIRSADKARMEKIEPYQKVVESVFNYSMPDESLMKKYTRKQWNVPDKAWLVITVGNRMDDELEENFLKTMDSMLDTIEDAYFMLVGKVKNPESYLRKLKNRKKVCFPGQIPDVGQVIRLANVYVQPKRKGGGRTAFESLYYGVPIVVPNYGDVWDVTGDCFSVENYEQMLDRIIRFYKDRNYYNEYKALSREKSIMLQDIKMTFCNLFNKIGVEYKDIK